MSKFDAFESWVKDNGTLVPKLELRVSMNSLNVCVDSLPPRVAVDR